MSDYRCTKYCPELVDLEQKKDKVVELVKKDHPKASDMHAYISKKDQKYKIEFIKAYNGKCSYCGISLDLIPKSLFQIDHFVFQKAPEFKGSKAAAGTIDNLVLSCSACNYNKGEFLIPDEMRDLLHPDKEGICRAFFRDDNYYIRVSADYESNDTVKNFHEILQLGSELRRLDFLLMNMIGLKEKLMSKHQKYGKLNEAIGLLVRKRNIVS